MAVRKPGNSEDSPLRARQRERQHKLILACLQSPSGTISYEDVRELYQRWHPDARDEAHRRSQFRSDCGTLERHFREIAEIFLDAFFLPLPEVTYDAPNGRLSIPVGRRPIVLGKNRLPDRMAGRRELAKYVAEASWPPGPWEGSGQPLFPRSGRVYAGHGSTISILFHELLCASHTKLPDVTVYTASFEVAGLLYYLHQNAGNEVGGIRLGASAVVDRVTGTILPFETPGIGRVDVAVISCTGVYGGHFFSDADPRVHNFARAFLEHADRIVIVAECWKIGRTNGNEFVFPGLGKKPVLLVTDADEVAIREHLPEKVGFVQPPPSYTRTHRCDE